MARPFLLPNTPKMLIVALFGVSGIVGAPLLARGQTAAGQVNDAQQYRCLSGTSRCAYYQCDPTCRRTSAWETRDYNRGVDGDAPADTYSVGSSADSAEGATGGYDRRYDSQPAPGYDNRYTPSSGAGGYDQRYDGQASSGGYARAPRGDQQVGAAAPTAPGAGYGGGGYGGGGYSGNNYANAYGYQQGDADSGHGYDQQTYGRETYQNGYAAQGQTGDDQDAYGQNGYGRNGYPQPVNPPASAQGDDEDQGQDYADNQRPQQPSYRYSGQAQYRCVDDGDRCAYFRCDPGGDDCHRISAWSSRVDADRRPDDDGW